MSEMASGPAPAATHRRLSRRRARLHAWTDRAIRAAPWVLGALFGAAAIHLLTILALPTLWPGAPYRVLAAGLPLGETAILPRPGSDSRAVAFSDPFAAVALCRFDLSAGVTRIRAQADGAHSMSISVRLADGTIIYSGNDRDTPSGRFNIRLVTQKQADAEDAARSPDNGSGDETGQNAEQASSPQGAATDELRLASPSLRGFVAFRVLALREEDYDAASAALASARCAVEKPSP